MTMSLAEEETLFMSIGRGFLIGINLLSAVLGLLLCAGGAYLYIEYDNRFENVVSPGPIIGVMVAGFLLFAITMFGVYGAFTGKKWVLMTYLIVVVAILAVEVAASVLFLDYLNVIKATQTTDSSELSGSTEIAINNFIYNSYQTCCMETEYCYVNYTTVCTPAQLCSNVADGEDCVNADSFNAVDIGVCTAFEEIHYEGEVLVGTVESGNDVTCGGGSSEDFFDAVTGWLLANIRFFGYGAIGVGIVQVLIVICGLVLLLLRPAIIPEATVVRDSMGSPTSVYAQPVVTYSGSSSTINSSDRFSVQRSPSGQFSIQPSLSGSRRDDDEFTEYSRASRRK